MSASKGVMNFDPYKDIQSLDGQVIFITGGTAGIGASTLKSLAAHNPSHIYFTGRNTQASETLINSLNDTLPSSKLTFIKMDMTSLASVKAAIKEDFKHDRLDILICNAGIMAKPPELSKDNYEIQFAVNHLAHAMTIQCLLPTMLETAKPEGRDVRIVTLSSQGYRFHPRPGILFDELQSHSPIDRWFLGPRVRYGQSKLANIMYASELARRYPQITSMSVHPGVVKTDLVAKSPFVNRTMIYIGCWVMGIPLLEPEQGAWNSLWAAAAADKGELRNGGFYMPVGKDGTDSVLDDTAKDEGLARKLWSWTDGILGRF